MKCIAAASLLAALAASPASAQVLYSTSFEQSLFNPGPLRSQDGWGLGWSGGTDTDDVVTGTAATGLQSVRHDSSVLAALQAGGVGRTVGTWPVLNNRPFIRLSWKSFIASGQSGNAIFGMATLTGAGPAPWYIGGAAALDLQGNLLFSDENSDGLFSGTAAPLDQWNEMAIYCNFAKLTYTVTINGRIHVLDAPFDLRSDAFFRAFAFLTQVETSSTAVGYSDDLLIEGLVNGPCYANCDGSSTAPILNVDDFTCFINTFAHGQSLTGAQQVFHQANCDGSTIAPVLNVDDFTCFINAFALACP